MSEEKKKRGRPPGSGKKKSEGDYMPHSPLEPLAEFVEDMAMVQKKIAQLKGEIPNPKGKPIDINAIPETPFPDNWSAMGKVEKLKFLTANPRK